MQRSGLARGKRDSLPRAKKGTQMFAGAVNRNKSYMVWCFLVIDVSERVYIGLAKNFVQIFHTMLQETPNRLIGQINKCISQYVGFLYLLHMTEEMYSN